MSGISITCVISSLGCGGAERVMANLTRRLAALGYGVTLLTLDATIPDHFALSPAVGRRTLPEHAIASCRWFDWRSQRARNAGLREAILWERPRLVISFLDSVNISVLMALSGSGVPVIVAEHTDPRFHDIGWRWSLLRRFWYPRAARVVMLTEGTRQWAESQWPRWRATAIPNAVEPMGDGVESPRPEFFGARTVLAMGRLGPEKGYDRLLRAFADLAGRFPGWKLVIFGEGAERAALERSIADFGLGGRVELPGIVANPGSILPSADLFVLSSRFEGFPMALAEAMVCGVPVVAFDCPSGPAEIIRDGVDGLLVPRDNVDALRAAMARLMGDEAERRRLGERGREVAERFAPERIVGMWRDLIEEVVGSRDPAGNQG